MNGRKRKAKMPPLSRKAKLVLAGVKQSELADQLNVSPAAISMVMNDKIRSQRIEEAISAALGEPHERVFSTPDQPTPKSKKGVTRGTHQQSR